MRDNTPFARHPQLRSLCLAGPCLTAQEPSSSVFQLPFALGPSPAAPPVHSGPSLAKAWLPLFSTRPSRRGNAKADHRLLPRPGHDHRRHFPRRSPQRTQRAPHKRSRLAQRVVVDPPPLLSRRSRSPQRTRRRIGSLLQALSHRQPPCGSFMTLSNLLPLVCF